MTDTTLTIASIFPLPLKESRPLYQPVNSYEMEAALPGEVKYLVIGDAAQPEYRGYGRTTPETITALEIAKDLVKCWTQNFSGVDSNVARPGVMILRGKTIEPDELELLNKVQNEFARAMVLEGDVFHQEGRPDKISKKHRVLADWIGTKGRPWQEHLSNDSKVICPFCATPNAAFASKCVQCREVIDEERYQATQAQIRAGKAASVNAKVQKVVNKGRSSVVDLSQADVDEMLAATAKE